MTNSEQIHEFHKVNRGKFIFQTTVRWLIRGMEVMKKRTFQLNISWIMPARQKKTQGHGV